MIDIYLESLYLIEEGLPKELVNTVSNENKKMSILKKIKGMIDVKNPVGTFAKIQQIPIPSVSPSIIDKLLINRVPNYKKNKEKAKTILKNSLSSNINESVLNASSIAICLLATASKDKNDSYDKNFKNVIKNVVNKTRSTKKIYESDEEERTKEAVPREYIYDYALGMSIIIIAIGIAYAVATGSVFMIYTLMKILTSMGPGVFWALAVIVIIVSLCILLGKLSSSSAK